MLVIAFSIVGPGHTGIAQKSDRPDALPPSVGRIQQGKSLYEGLARCLHCYGPNALRRVLTDRELFSIIKFGVPSTSHIPYKHLLSDEEIWSIVYYQLNNICIHGCTKKSLEKAYG